VTTIIERHREAIGEDPEDVQAFEALQEYYFLEGEWEDLVHLYRRRLEAPSLQGNPQSRVPVLNRLGQMLEERCARVDEAEEVYWEIASIAPKFRPALRQLRHIYDGRGQWDMVLQIAEIEGQIEMSAAERSRFLADLGEVWLDHRDDASEAIDCFGRALDGDPHQQKALFGIARAQQKLGRAEDAARSWERLVHILRGPERAPALVALGKVYAGPLREIDLATTCFRKAMTDDPRNEDAVEALVVITATLEQWDLLADLYERRFNLASGARHRSAIALEAGNMQLQRLNNRVAARSWFERARELLDDEVSVHHAMAELERFEADHASLQHSLDRIIEISGRKAPVSVLLEAADLHAESGQKDRALRYLEMAQAHKPDDPLVLEALSDALGHANRPSDLADVLERRAAMATDDPQAQADALCELSRLHEEELGDSEAALGALERAFEANPQLGAVRGRLQRLYRKTERFDDLRQLLERSLGQATSAENTATSCELGFLLLEHYQDIDGSRRAFEHALEADSGSSRALQGLEQVARVSGDDDAVLALCEREAASATDPDRLAELVGEITPLLESRDEREGALQWIQRLLELRPGDRTGLETAARLHEAAGQTDELVQTLTTLDAQLEGAEQTANRRRLATLHHQLGHTDAAVAVMESAIACNPDDLDAVRELVDLYRGAHRYTDMASLQRRLADMLPPAESAACLDELATVLDSQLGDVDAAIVVLWRLVEMPERPAQAPERLENLLERAGRYEELAQQLSEHRRRMLDPSDEADALDLRRAHILMDRLGQLEEAAQLFRAVRSRNPASSEATEGLEQALRSGNDAAGLSMLLESRARNESDPAARAHIEFERAVLLEEELGDQEAALAVYDGLAEQACELSITSLAGLRIERILERRGDWVALRARLETHLEDAIESEAWELRERLAALCRDRLADREGCIEHLEAMGRIDADRAETWRELAMLYHELGRDPDWLRVSQAELATDPDPERELVIRSNAGALCAERARGALPDAEECAASARDHYERVLELAPTHSEASEFLIQHYEQSDQPEEVARLLRARLTDCAEVLAADPGSRTSLELRLADWQAERLGDHDGALATLEESLRHTTHVTAVAQPLVQLYERTGRDGAVIGLCQRAASACEGPAERADWQLRLGHALQRAGELREASEAFCEALQGRPGDRETEAILRGLYRELDDAQPLAALLESEIPRSEPEQQVALRIELAALQADRLDRGEEALAHLRAALEIDRDHTGAFDLAMRLSELQDRQEEMLTLLDARLSGSGSPLQRADWMERRGQLLAGRLDRPEEAASAYRQTIALDPDRRSARQALREVMEQLGRWSAVLDCLHLEASAENGHERVATLERAVEIAREHLSGDAALPWLERLRSERPEDPEVLEQIAELHRQAGRPEALLRALEAQLALVDDTSRRRDIYANRARIFERDLHAPGRAISALETARDLTPDDPEVLGELDRLYDLMGRTRERVEVLEIRLTQAPPAERIELHRQAALLRAASLAEPERATPHLLRAYALAGEVEASEESTPRITLLRELAETLRASARTDAWVRAAEAELDALNVDSDDGRRRIAELHLELAAAYGHELGLPDTARQHLLAVNAMVDVASLLPPDRMRRAELELIDALRAERNHVALADHLSRRLAAGAGDAGDWLELARLRAESLHAPAAAADAYREALARQPDDLGAIRGLRHVAECLRDWPEVAHTLELELDARAHPSPRERSTLHKKLGEVCWHRLEALDRAADAFAAALAEMPGDLEAIRSLQSVQERRQAWAEAADLYEREIGLLGNDDGARASSLWLQSARVSREQLGDEARALRAYEAASDHGPLAATDQHAFAELYRESGDLARYAETYTIWCDDPDADTSVWDHLALVGALLELGRHDAALARAIRASEVAPNNAEAWDRVAELHRELGDRGEARNALERAAALHEPRPAGKRLVEAAALCESSESEEAAALLRQAIVRDPALVVAHADLATVAERRGDLEEAESAAGCAIDLLDADADLPGDRQLEVALVGGRCARALERFESAAEFFAAALERDAACLEALEAQCEVLYAQDEWVAARKLADARLDLQGENSARARQLAISGRGLEAADDTGAAIARYRQALEADAALSLAHEGLVRIHEATGQSDRAIAALEQWIENDDDASTRAAARMRAARHLLDADLQDRAEQNLRAAVEDDRGLNEAWGVLVEMLGTQERDDDALAAAERALETLEAPEWRARVSLVMARILDGRRESRRAIDAYAETARGDTRCVEAALARARLLRAAGEWPESAEALSAFASAHPDPESLDLARVHLERGRLMAGPLEQVEEAIRCYERALELAPDLTDAREPLAALLAHSPERWRDALASHRMLLAKDPTRTASMRALLEIGQRRQWEDATRFGLAILRALGAATPEENGYAPHALPEAIGAPEQLSDPVWETARKICRTGAQEIETAIQGEPGSRDIEVGEGEAGTLFSDRQVAAETELTAPGLSDLSLEELSSVILTVTTLATDPGGNCNDGPYMHELDQALGRWSRRKIRKTLGAYSVRDIQGIDYQAWRDELRLNAACMALDCGEGDLRDALITLAGRNAEAAALISDSADISSLVAGSTAARRLLARVVDAWSARLNAAAAQ